MKKNMTKLLMILITISLLMGVAYAADDFVLKGIDRIKEYIQGIFIIIVGVLGIRSVLNRKIVAGLSFLFIAAIGAVLVFASDEFLRSMSDFLMSFIRD